MPQNKDSEDLYGLSDEDFITKLKVAADYKTYMTPPHHVQMIHGIDLEFWFREAARRLSRRRRNTLHIAVHEQCHTCGDCKGVMLMRDDNVEEHISVCMDKEANPNSMRQVPPGHYCPRHTKLRLTNET